jgi:hypothetical protein
MRRPRPTGAVAPLEKNDRAALISPVTGTLRWSDLHCSVRVSNAVSL